MKKILSLCINLLLFIISEAVPLKLIAGERSVVKKDGATHTISKYYVVPNDFNPNNVTNSTETSQTTLRMNHNLYSKSMNADIASQHQVSEKKAEAANNQTNENNAGVNNNEEARRSDLSDVQVVQAESTGSVKTEQNLGPDDLGNLQVEPIANFTNNSNVTTNEGNVYNSSEALQNGTIITVENTTQTFKKDVGDKLEDFILTKYTAVQESSVQNLESFWKLIKLNIDRISDDDELFRKIEKLSLLLNIYTNLYEAAHSQKPVESMIDSIIDILHTPFVEAKKSNTNESQSQTNLTGDYDEECLRKCGQKRFKPQLDSNGTYLSETESQEASDNLKLKNLDIERRHRGDSDDEDDWVNTYNDPGSNQVAVTKQPSNILGSQLLVPKNLNVGVPDGFNVRSSILTPTLNHVSGENDIEEDPKSNQKNPYSADIDEHLNDQPLTIESKLADNIMSWHIKDKTTDNLPWHIEDKTTDNLPWHIEDKTTDHQPWIIEHRTTNSLPWTIVDRGPKKLPRQVKNRADPNWTIENIMGHSPKTLYQSRYPNGGKILLHPNQPMTATIHSVKHRVKKPYHIYTYIINPETSLYEIPTSGNIAKVKSRQPNANLETRLYGLSTSHGANKIVYANQPSPSYYESQFTLSKPSVDISSQTNNTQLKHTNYVTATHDTSNEVNPSDLLSEIIQDDNQPKYLVGPEPETNPKASLLQPNTLASDSQTNSGQENEVPQVPEVGSYPGVLLPNVPSNPFESLINLGYTEPVSPASADTSDVNPDIGDTEPNPYNPNINLNSIQETNLHPGVISKDSYYSKYTNLPHDYDELRPVYGRETHAHPGLISTASSSSAYTNLPHEYDEPSPVYGGETHKHLGLISTASSSSEYTNLPDDYDKSTPVYDRETHKHPGLISTASSSSAYTNLPDDYDELSPVYGRETHAHPGLISTASSSSAYTNLPHDYDEPSPVYGGETHKHPGLISIASSSSEYTNLPDDYDKSTPVYDRETHKHPGLISTASSSSAYTNLPDDYDELSPVYGRETHAHPGLISTASSSSVYTNLPHDYDEPSPVYGGETHKHPGLISTASSSSAYTNLPDDYDELSPVYDRETHKHPGLISTASSSSAYTNLPDDYDKSSPVYDRETHKHPGLISTASSSSEYTNLPDDYDKSTPIHDRETHKHPGLISTASSSSAYTNLPDDYDELSPVYDRETHKYPGLISTASSSSAYTNLPDDYDELSPVYDRETHKHPGLISTASSSSAYTNLPDDYDKSSPVYDIETYKHPGLISTASSSSEYTKLPDEYDEPVYDEQTHQHPTLITSSAASSSLDTNFLDEYDEPVYDEQTHQHLDLISSLVSSSSGHTNLPDEYDEPIYVVQTDQHPGLISSSASSNSEYKNVVHGDDNPIPLYGGQIQKHPGFISKASSHSEYKNLPNEYNNPTSDYEEDTNRYPVHIQTPVNGRPTKIEDNLLVYYHPYGHKEHIVQPSLIAHLHGNQPTGRNYLKHLKLKLAPTYRLFTLDNLLKLHDAVIKTIKANGDKSDVYDNQGLINFSKIINIILIVAEHLEEPEGSIEWYEKIFYNTQRENRHPLEFYAYNLIRQRWLHELLLVLYKNNFNFNILQKLRIFSFLGSWQFPNNILNFMEIEELLQHKFDAPKHFDQTFSSQYGLQDKFATHTYDDVLEEVPENLENYVTNNVIESYKRPNAGIVLSIAGVEAEPDANAIINILHKYLHYKSFIEKQENLIVHDNEVEMLKQIILLLSEKGYDASTIADLIRKLYTAVYSAEGKGCKTHHTNFANFAKNMYDVILPVLRRSGR